MMNAKDIAAKKFDKAAMFGYKTEEVDEYLRQMSDAFAAVTKENAELEKKLEILADKIREYRNDEEALKDALLGAQRQGNLIISDAKRVAEGILTESKMKADELNRSTTEQTNKMIADAQKNREEIMADLQRKSEREQKTMELLRKEVSDFKASLLSMYKAHLSNITKLPELVEKNEQHDDMTKEIESDIDEKLTFTEEADTQNPEDEETGKEAAANESAQKPEDNQNAGKSPLFQKQAPKQNAGFGELQFGKNKE